MAGEQQSETGEEQSFHEGKESGDFVAIGLDL